jgi:S-methylmethionine-dependent homocysteine/selenocysteine methylase
MIVLDGATGTMLGERARGRLFSAAALVDEEGRESVLAIHKAYAAAGAQVVTANTFRTGPRAAGARWHTLSRAAVALARKSGATIAGSIAPAEDCYRPELRPPREAALREHGQLALALAAHGCDLQLVETVASAEEGLAAVEAAVATGLCVWVSAMALPSGTMLSGDDLRDFFRAARERGATAALLNCIPCDGVDLALDAARESGLPFGAYAHMGEIDPASGWPSTPVLSPEEYAERARRWLERGATIVGGCCGTTPAHIEALARISPERHDPCHPDRRLMQ